MANESPSNAQSNQRISILILLFLLAAPLLHWGAWNYQFVNYDDPEYVTTNPAVLQGLSLDGVKWAFTTTHAANWHPLTWVSHMIDISLYGGWAGGHHLTSIFLHGLNAAFLFLFLRVGTRRTLLSLLGASLFLVHPLHVESVLWVAERKDVLSASFALASLAAYGHGVQNERPRWKWFAFLLVAVGMLAKPMLVTWPFVLLLVDIWPLRRTESWLMRVREKAPLFALVFALAVMTVIAQRGGGSVAELGLLDFGERAANAVVSYPRYVAKFVWPQPLAVFYPHPSLSGERLGWSAGTVALAGVACALLIALMVWRRSGPIGVGIAWFLGMLVPVIGLVQVGSQSMADRYMYLPGIGLVFAVVFGIVSRWRRAGVLLLIAIVILTWRARVEGRRWSDSETLFRHATEVTHDNWIAWNNLGTALRRQERAEEAVRAYDQALKAHERYASAHFNRANALVDLRRLDEAEQSFRRALAIDPDYLKAMNNLARCLVAQGRTEEAVPWMRQAFERSPDNPSLCLNLANMLAGIGQSQAAFDLLEQNHMLFARQSRELQRRAAALHGRLKAELSAER